MHSDPKVNRVAIMMGAEMLAACDEFRWDHRLGSQAEAIRTLIAAGISASKRGLQEAATGEGFADTAPVADARPAPCKAPDPSTR